MVILENMVRKEFQCYLDQVLEEYSKDLAITFNINQAEAIKKAREDIASNLPEGFDTPDQFFCFIKRQSTLEEIGTIWYGHRPENAYSFLADIQIHGEYRGRGYGTKALALLEKTVVETGLRIIMLHVFKHNQKAKKLYEKLGYEVIQETDKVFNMVKRF